MEICAMSNSSGGIIYVGIKDNNTVVGLSQQEIAQYNQRISNASNENIKPAIYPQTKIAEIDSLSSFSLNWRDVSSPSVISFCMLMLFQSMK